MSDYKCILGDSAEKLKLLVDNSVDAIVTDPPYGLNFMGKGWDKVLPAKEIWNECFRVLKPGGYMLVFGGSRTFHRIYVNVEDAGFEIRDTIIWIYGSGYPKSLNVAKSMDKMLRTGNASWNGTGDKTGTPLGYSKLQYEQGYRPADYGVKEAPEPVVAIEMSDEAAEHNGWGSALKPSFEPICMARKPLSEKNIVSNIQKWSVGGINIDASRIGGIDTRQKTGGAPEGSGRGTKAGAIAGSPLGRFPANTILECMCEDTETSVLEATKGDKEYITNKDQSVVPLAAHGATVSYKGGVTTHTNPDCPCAMLDEQSGQAASRFFYCAKSSRSEKEEGLSDGKKDTKRLNVHPTVKPIKLMSYLCKLVCPEGGIILDPFMGSGSTGVAAVKEGFDFIGIELEEESCKIAEQRIQAGLTLKCSRLVLCTRPREKRVKND